MGIPKGPSVKNMEFAATSFVLAPVVPLRTSKPSRSSRDLPTSCKAELPESCRKSGFSRFRARATGDSSARSRSTRRDAIQTMQGAHLCRACILAKSYHVGLSHTARAFRAGHPPVVLHSHKISRMAYHRSPGGGQTSRKNAGGTTIRNWYDSDNISVRSAPS